ncbi:MAG TPA: DUF6174 domain-containing protein [Gammaproteobacteria bacterium]|nr:DUF6174 domain-containing protein [Gammaproteobacteria bacterium]
MRATVYSTEHDRAQPGARAAGRCTIGLLAALLAQAVGSQELDSNRAVWKAAGIESYDYSYQRVCECHPDIPADTIVAVRDGQVAGVRYAREDYVADVELPADRWRWFRTIDDLFTLVESAQARTAVVRVSFDERFGYPRAIYIDYVADLVGDEVDMKVTSFAPAP